MFSLNIFILHQLRDIILISLDSASWKLHQYSRRMCGPMKISKLTPAPRNRTRELMFARPTLYLTIKDTTDDNVSIVSSSNTCSVDIYYCFVIPIAHVNMGCCDTSCQKFFFLVTMIAYWSL